MGNTFMSAQVTVHTYTLIPLIEICVKSMKIDYRELCMRHEVLYLVVKYQLVNE